MNIDINEMFSEKNRDLFLHKLVLDLENNADAFKLATKHIVMIETAKLLSSLKRIYEKYVVSYDEEKLKSLLSRTKTSLLEDINLVIDEKTSTNKKYVEESDDKKVNKGYLKNYHQRIDDNESLFNESFLLVVKEATEVNLYNSLISLYSCENEEMQQDILRTVNVDFSHSISTRIIKESQHRSMTLKNISGETFEKYLELSKNSTQPKKQPKLKIKKEN